MNKNFSDPWRYLHAARGEPNAVANFQQLAKAWETRALAAEAANRDLRKENTALREQLNARAEESLFEDSLE